MMRDIFLRPCDCCSYGTTGLGNVSVVGVKPDGWEH